MEIILNTSIRPKNLSIVSLDLEYRKKNITLFINLPGKHFKKLKYSVFGMEQYCDIKIKLYSNECLGVY